MNAQQPRRTRVEDYLWAVEELSQGGRRATNGDIARRLGVAGGTASGMMRELAAAGWVDLVPYAGVTLTEQGRLQLRPIVRKRQLLEWFLQHTLAISREEASAESWRLEPSVSANLIQRIEAYREGGQGETKTATQS
ncbi:MAG: metal-dependent transcriptional regulator [Novipirellula sp. JB048]